MSTRNLKEQIDELDGVDVFSKVIGEELRPGKKILSPLRGESHPSFNIWRSRNGKVLYKDFAAETGDIYGYVMKRYNCNFKEAVEHIASAVGVYDEGDTKGVLRPLRRFIEKIPSGLRLQKRAKVSIVPRKMNDDDLRYWGGFGIEEEILKYFRVQACHSVELTNTDGDERTTFSICTYAFVYPSGNIKIYNPASKRGKFYGNTTTEDIFGLAQLMAMDVVNNVIICAGQKDTMTMHTLTDHTTACIALNSETAELQQDIYVEIMERCTDNIFVCYDNDDTGMVQMDKIIRKYPFIIPIYIDTAPNMGANYNDVADAVMHGKAQALGHHILTVIETHNKNK